MLDKRKAIIGGVIGLVVLVVLVLLLFKALGGLGNKEHVSLEFWGTFDKGSWYEDAIRDFRREHPNVDIQYTSFTFEEYEDALVKALAAGSGPDIWLMHNTWLPRHFNKIEPMPERVAGEELMLLKDFQLQFVDVAISDLTANGVIYAVPLYVDTLGLYYNKDMFNDAGITRPPKTWDEFNDAVRKLTRRDANGNIIRSAASIGTARNINRSTDLLMMLMLQSGTRMTNQDNSVATFSNPVNGVNTGESALQYYTDFADRRKSTIYTWDDLQHYSIDAFAQGETAMLFNYSHHIPTIRSRSARFNFGVAPVPQVSGSEFAVTYANYWAPTVSKQSQHTDEAWQFLVYLSSAEGSQAYINASARPSARRDFIDQQTSDPDLGVFAEQALTARSWYQVENTTIETIFADMIDDVNFNRKSVRDALEAAQSRVNVLMSRAQ